jgi:DNA-binding response OmpR family regulator
MLDFGAKRNLPTVLLIDDDLVSREVMATVLTMSGYTVYTADGGAASLELLAAGKCVPGVILMDAQMPGLSGTPLIEQLRARSHARVYAMSGSDAPDDVIAASDGFLLKPFAPDALDKLVEEHAAQANPDNQPSSKGQGDVEPVVNLETLAQLRELMSETAVRQIYAAIVADLAKRLTALEVAIANRDAAEVRRIGHAIKGGCGMAGALQAARLGALLETTQFEPVSDSGASSSPESEGNHLDNSTAVLLELRAAARNLERMLETEFPA